MDTIVFRTLGAWGAGKGANLLPSEIDSNFWSLVQAIVDLQSNPALPVGIASISVAGTQMTITLTDGTVLGPYTLPVLTFRWRGEWMPSTIYAALDVFTVTSVGIFMVQIGHTSGATFDSALTIGGQPALLQLFGSTDVIIAEIADQQLMANLSGSTAVATGYSLSDILDYDVGSTQGMLLYRTSTGWVALAPGTAGQVLTTGGAAANPSWAAGGGGVTLPSGTAGDQLVYVSGAWTAQRPRYIIGAFAPGLLTASQIIIDHRVTKAITIPANFGAYLGHTSMARGSANATASTAIDVQRATSAAPGTFTSVGTITIAAGAMVGTFASSGGAAVSFAQGDTLALVGPATPDATFAGLAATLVGYET